MRKILFRGKRVDTGEWVFGQLLSNISYSKPLIITSADLEDNGEVSWDYYPVEPATVGQFIGMKDMNGKQIFEGDVVVYDNTPYTAYAHRVTGEIVWHKLAWQFKYAEDESVYHYLLGTEDLFWAKSVVIGTIHDNPELVRCKP